MQCLDYSRCLAPLLCFARFRPSTQSSTRTSCESTPSEAWSCRLTCTALTTRGFRRPWGTRPIWSACWQSTCRSPSGTSSSTMPRGGCVGFEAVNGGDSILVLMGNTRSVWFLIILSKVCWITGQCGKVKQSRRRAFCWHPIDMILLSLIRIILQSSLERKKNGYNLTGLSPGRGCTYY